MNKEDKEILDLIRPIINDVLSARVGEMKTKKKVHDEIYHKLVELLTDEDINKVLQYKFEVDKVPTRTTD